MSQVEDRVFIPLPRMEVFRFAARPENMPAWVPAITHSAVIGRLRRGARVEQHVRLLGRNYQTVFDVTAYEPFRRVAYRSTGGPMDVNGVMEFRTEPGGTLVRWVVQGNCHWFGHVSEAVLLAMGRREMHAALTNLRLQLTGSPAMRSATAIRPA